MKNTMLVREAAEALRITRQGVHYLIGQGRIRAVPDPETGWLRLSRDDVEQLIAQYERSETPA